MLNQPQTIDEDVIKQDIQNIVTIGMMVVLMMIIVINDGGDDTSYHDVGDCKEINGRTNCKIIH